MAAAGEGVTTRRVSLKDGTLRQPGLGWRMEGCESHGCNCKSWSSFSMGCAHFTMLTCKHALL